MAVLFALLAVGAAVATISLLVALCTEGETKKIDAVLVAFVGVGIIVLSATLLAGFPTGESLGVIPPEGVYPAKIVLIGEENNYADEVFLMLYLRERMTLHGVFKNPEPIKVYRVPKSRFVNSPVSSNELIEIAVFYDLEYKQRMIKVVPQAP